MFHGTSLHRRGTAGDMSTAEWALGVTKLGVPVELRASGCGCVISTDDTPEGGA